MKDKSLEGKMLTELQIIALKDAVVDSMKGAYTDKGENPSDRFYRAAGVVADKIIKEAQKSIIRAAAFDKAMNTPKKSKKAVKKAVKKTVKKAVKKVAKKVIKKRK